jgi:mannose-1-phosphate guanylyltransferase
LTLTAPRALVLAAGRGERLRPLSDAIPKPLLPVLGVPVIERTLRWLAAAGVKGAAVNLHHLGEAIAAALGGEVDGMPLTFSHETRLLGTLGPLARLRSFLAGSDPVLLVNGDSLCEWPVEEVLAAHRTRGADATLLLSTRADPDLFGGGVAVDDEGRVVSFRGAAPPGAHRRCVFAGLHAISATLLEGLVEAPADIVRDLYEPRLAAGAVISAVFSERPWHDLGTPRRYLDGVLECAVAAGGSWRHGEARVDPTARVERAVLEAGSVVEAGAVIESSLLLPGARAGAGSRVRDAVVGPRVEVVAGASLDGVLLAEGLAGSGPAAVPL